jgi:SAM-dependent methyltransferase
MKLENFCHVSGIIKVARCPICKSSNWLQRAKDIVCLQCETVFLIRQDSVDFVSTLNKNYENSEERYIYERAMENWGEILHEYELNDIPEAYHHIHFINYFGSRHTLFKGIVLEIGCGSGFDAQWTAKEYPELSCYGVDLGENIAGLSHRDRSMNNLHYMRGDALNLPLENEVADSILSFGVFHHTPEPRKCMDEAYRVLKSGGSICIYLYTNHENNLPKYIGTKVEKLLMNFMAVLPTKVGRMLCWTLSPLILLIFSWPGQMLKRIPGLKKIGGSFPLHWGTTPASIIGDLQDRLCAPINHRYSRKEFESLFAKSGFTNLEVVTTTGGHFGYAEKL